MVEQLNPAILPAAGDCALAAFVFGVQYRKLISKQVKAFRLKLPLPVERFKRGRRNSDLPEAAVKRIVVDLAALVIHDPEPERIGLQTQIDVLADEDHRFVRTVQRRGDTQNPVVRRGGSQVPAEKRVNPFHRFRIEPG